ncbi:hypothetical protein [Mesorhizobium sp.]|uniref:hypothetical protein n=1 Tax=Mesorhizobium sp. TaxID=1871066 RepID=UPI00120FE7A3|nr:hypothetical protein [Mesorhizobium sp.]TIL53803.1 MAG: hypothetical protein E5Y83_05805 [Mesorhizobium sp.]
MNRQKLTRAQSVTDKLWDSFQKAQDSLRTFNVNGVGILADRSLLRSNLVTAKAALEAALKEMDDFKDWPTDEEYERWGF